MWPITCETVLYTHGETGLFGRFNTEFLLRATKNCEFLLIFSNFGLVAISRVWSPDPGYTHAIPTVKTTFPIESPI